MLDDERTALRETHPTPQFVRPDWASLDGPWAFRYDDEDRGLRDGWHRAIGADREIVVPFPPESELSGIGDTAFHPVVWYERTITAEELTRSGRSPERPVTLLRFGAVDYRARVWVDGELVGSHEGGQSPFAVDISRQAAEGRDILVVVRAEDDPLDVSQPRGKQDWLVEPHVIWYHRTTGIWQPVWLESRPELALRSLAWSTDVASGVITLEYALSRRPAAGARLSVALTLDGERLADVSVAVDGVRGRLPLSVEALAHGQAYERLLWSPEHPRLVDATVELTDAASGVADTVHSYLGIRSIATGGRRLLLNDRPYLLRAVLEQGYWPQSHLAAPSADALRAEVQLMKDLGFNAARLHEKAEDPRFLYWTDRLGLLVWGELASPFEFSTDAVQRYTREWLDVVDRDRSHPSLVTWVPVNESWGVQHVSHDPAQLAFIRALYQLTKALDPTRPVVSNDGWEHAESDLVTVHDYEYRRQVLEERYGDEAGIAGVLDGVGPAGRVVALLPLPADAPVLVTEFGGVSFAPDSEIRTWGYSVAESAEDFEQRLEAVFAPVRDSAALAGYCYTQLTDTLQEANGLTDEHRRPKLPVETLRRIITGY